MKTCTCLTKTPDIRFHLPDCEYRLHMESLPATRYLTIRVALNTCTHQQAEELARDITMGIADAAGEMVSFEEEPELKIYEIVDQVYYTIDIGDGSDLGM